MRPAAKIFPKSDDPERDLKDNIRLQRMIYHIAHRDSSCTCGLCRDLHLAPRAA